MHHTLYYVQIKSGVFVLYGQRKTTGTEPNTWDSWQVSWAEQEMRDQRQLILRFVKQVGLVKASKAREFLFIYLFYK